MFNKNTLHALFSIKNFFYKCPSNFKEQLFITLVKPLLDYGFALSNFQIDRFELIKKREARFITTNHKREHGNNKKKNMIQLGWSPLCERRAKIKRSMLHEIQTRSTIHIPSEGLIRGKQLHC